MKKKTRAPYGAWKSPITTEMVATSGMALQEVRMSDSGLYWLAMMPDAAATYQIFRLSGRKKEAVLPTGFSARGLVYDYGGGSFVADGETVYFVNYSTLYPATNDQRVYRLSPGMAPVPLTPLINARYGDLSFHRQSGRVICVMEDYESDAEGSLSIVAIDAQGSAATQVLCSGADYYSSPSISPDEKRLAWISWAKPNMPWDDNELWIADLDKTGGMVAGSEKRVTKSKQGSGFQPVWSSDSKSLFFVHDRDGWWRPYVFKVADASTKALLADPPERAEFGGPQWNLGMSLYAILDARRTVHAFTTDGQWQLAVVDTKKRSYETIPLAAKGKPQLTDISQVTTDGRYVYFLGGGPLVSESLFRLNLKTRSLKKIDGETFGVGSAYVSRPKPTTIKPGGDDTCYGFYYPPTNPDFAADPAERPPLLIKTHGGPTAMTSTTLNKEIQYFTSRGFAVVDVNYRGSTGYGRTYRHSLYKQWGVFDRDDCVHAAVEVASQGKADLKRCVARGVSAGGYLTVVQATYTRILAAGCSYSGITNMLLLYAGTHKFEKYYIISLLGATNEPSDFDSSYYDHMNTYKLRSPYYVAGISTTPMMFVQGKEDKVVPPDQTEVMVQKLKDQGVPVVELMFADEQHGLRKPANVISALNAEYYFYSQVLGFRPADDLPPVPIANWPR